MVGHFRKSISTSIHITRLLVIFSQKKRDDSGVHRPPDLRSGSVRAGCDDYHYDRWVLLHHVWMPKKPEDGAVVPPKTVRLIIIFPSQVAINMGMPQTWACRMPDFQTSSDGFAKGDSRNSSELLGVQTCSNPKAFREAELGHLLRPYLQVWRTNPKNHDSTKGLIVLILRVRIWVIICILCQKLLKSGVCLYSSSWSACPLGDLPFFGRFKMSPTCTMAIFRGKMMIDWWSFSGLSWGRSRWWDLWRLVGALACHGSGGAPNPRFSGDHRVDVNYWGFLWTLTHSHMEFLTEFKGTHSVPVFFFAPKAAEVISTRFALPGRQFSSLAVGVFHHLMAIFKGESSNYLGHFPAGWWFGTSILFSHILGC